MNGLIYLMASAVCEAFWNVFLTRSDGIGDWRNNVLGIAFLLTGIITFKKALSYMPLSIANVIWTGASLLLTVIADRYLFKTRIDIRIAFFMGLCLLSIIGLNYYSNQE